MAISSILTNRRTYTVGACPDDFNYDPKLIIAEIKSISIDQPDKYGYGLFNSDGNIIAWIPYNSIDVIYFDTNKEEDNNES